MQLFYTNGSANLLASNRAGYIAFLEKLKDNERLALVFSNPNDALGVESAIKLPLQLFAR